LSKAKGFPFVTQTLKKILHISAITVDNIAEFCMKASSGSTASA